MASRLDELHGHQYATQRVVNAVTRHDADPTMRRPRSLTLVLVGGMVAALVAVGTLVYNALTGQGGPRDLRNTATVLIEKESGAQFVYTKADGQLHPVLNYASGLLLAEGSGAAPTTVRRERLASLRRAAGIRVGTTLGIPDAPNALPRPADLARDAWHVCSELSGGAAPRTSLLAGGAAVSGGRQLGGPAPTSPGEALLVQAPDRRVFVVFANAKFLLREPGIVLAAFGWTGRPRQPVSTGWINALPSGTDLATPSIAGLGEPSRAVRDTIGRLYRAPGPRGDQWAVVRRDTVQPITDVQARLLQADPQTPVGQPVQVSTADFATLTSTADPAPDVAPDNAPAVVPALQSISSSACVRVDDAATGVAAVVVDPNPAGAPPAARASGGAPVPATADNVSVPFGRGVLVRAAASPTTPAGSGSVSIVTDAGIRYPIADNDALTRLGYGGRDPVAMPAELVALLPVGPALSTAAARTP